MYVGYLDSAVSEKECELTIVSMLLGASFFSSDVFHFLAPSMGPSERQYSDLSDISPDDRKRCALWNYTSKLYETLMSHHEHLWNPSGTKHVWLPHSSNVPDSSIFIVKQLAPMFPDQEGLLVIPCMFVFLLSWRNRFRCPRNSTHLKFLNTPFDLGRAREPWHFMHLDITWHRHDILSRRLVLLTSVQRWWKEDSFTSKPNMGGRWVV